MRKKPTNRNPLVNDDPRDTLGYVDAVLSFVQDACGEDIDQQDGSPFGLYLTLDCVREALRYTERQLDEELRKKSKAKLAVINPPEAA